MDELDLFLDAAQPDPERGYLTVSEITRRARYLVESGFDRLWVQGEISGFKSYSSGHWYFTLRDKTSQVRCVMWRTDNQRVREQLADGLQVFVEVTPTVWEERGEFRLTVKNVLSTAIDGSWQVRLQRARQALERDGLLDPARKRKLPAYPNRIAVVTSPDGAALRDMLSVIRKRWPAQVIVVPTLVQGDGAARSLVGALASLAKIPELDLVIVGRGGGSREDLGAFNEETVARALAAVPVPTISAVGHETDVSLSDLVADVRAATPSAAAEIAVPDRVAVQRLLADLARRLAGGLTGRTAWGWERLERTRDRMVGGMQERLAVAGSHLGRLGATLDALSPLRVLGRGYAVARDADGTILKAVDQFPPGRSFKLTVTDGTIGAKVVGVE
ncbi:MAG: exodeoxyribonuclease VII large subunit [Gemmatimonadales bacterium]